MLSLYTKNSILRHQKLHEKLLVESIESCNQYLSSNEKNEPQQQQQQQSKTEKKANVTKKVIKKKELIIHYRFEKGPLSTFNRKFRKLWEKHFCYEHSPLNHIRLILGTRSNPSLERLLIKKKPSRTLLTRMNSTIETTTVTTATTTTPMKT